MKTKLFLFIILVLSLSLGVFTACGDNEETSHTHEFTALKFNETEHWYECVCGETVSTKDAHFGGTATCTKKAVCKDCGIKFIPGIEITSYLDSTIGLYDDSYKVHVLGLNINSDQVAIELKRVEERKIEYHKRVMTDFISNSKLNTSIVDFSNRVSCAKLLYSLGAVDSMESAMSIFTVSPYALSIKDTIKCIHSAGA